LGTDETQNQLVDIGKIVSNTAKKTAKLEAEKIYSLEKAREPVNGVRAISLTKSYKSNLALRNVSFDVQKG
jgi:hypothetical protein